MYLTWGRLASHRSRQKYLDGQESKCTAIAHFCCDDLCEWSWSSYFTTHHDYISCAQPVLDFLLWHHLGPNYEERAHDLLQVNSNSQNFHFTLPPILYMRLMTGVQAIFLQLCQWDEPRPPGWAVHLEDRDTAYKVSILSHQSFALISVEILVTVAVWVLAARTPPTLIVRPAVDQNLGDHSHGPKAVGSALPCHLYIYTAWRLGSMLHKSGTAILMDA